MAMFVPKLQDTWKDSPGFLHHLHMFRVYACHWAVAFAFFFVYVGMYVCRLT